MKLPKLGYPEVKIAAVDPEIIAYDDFKPSLASESCFIKKDDNNTQAVIVTTGPAWMIEIPNVYYGRDDDNFYSIEPGKLVVPMSASRLTLNCMADCNHPCRIQSPTITIVSAEIVANRKNLCVERDHSGHFFHYGDKFMVQDFLPVPGEPLFINIMAPRCVIRGGSITSRAPLKLNTSNPALDHLFCPKAIQMSQAPPAQAYSWAP